MKPVRLFRHVNCSIPGYLCKFLEDRGIAFEIACIGVQMISKALGGKTSSDYKLEVGWHHAETAVDAEDAVRSLTQQFADDISMPSDCVQGSDELCSQLDERIDNLQEIADSIYSACLVYIVATATCRHVLQMSSRTPTSRTGPIYAA